MAKCEYCKDGATGAPWSPDSCAECFPREGATIVESGVMIP